MSPDYPVQPRVVRATGRRFAVVCLEQDDGRYVAEVLNHPEIRGVARTRRAAELIVSKIFLERNAAAQKNSVEDRLWLELARANKETNGITLESYRRSRGL